MTLSVHNGSKGPASRPRLSVVGLGKLGSPMVAVFAKKGYSVVGHDVNKQFVESLGRGIAPVEETGLQDLLDAHSENILATHDCAEAVHRSDITFLIVPTPSGSDHFFTNRYVVDAIRKVGSAIRSKKGYHLVVVTSTVMPGSTDGEIREALELASGRLVGPDLGLCYNPEFIALGSVVHDMLNPDMILIGESDTKAGDLLESVYRGSTDTKPEFHRMNCVNAELTKISVNTFVTTKISYANMISDMCDRLPGADAHVVSRAVGADSRVGRKYLKSAVGYGGPCFPRDNKAFVALGKSLGARCDLAQATDTINDYQLDRMIDAVEANLPAGGTVAVLGMSYKPSTIVVEKSHGLMLAENLASEGHRVLVFDPVAQKSAQSVLGDTVEYAESAESAVALADVVVIMTPSAEYAALKPTDFQVSQKSVSLIDPWCVASPEVTATVGNYVVPGRSMPVIVETGRISKAA